jgi:hypothetical protein
MDMFQSHTDASRVSRTCLMAITAPNVCCDEFLMFFVVMLVPWKRMPAEVRTAV